MQHRFLELEEEELDALARIPDEPRESHRLTFNSIAGGVLRAVEMAGAAKDIAPKTESPIEATLGGRLQTMVEQWNAAHKKKIELLPQWWLYRFRYDFAILSEGRMILAIECDGKDYHSGEQARLNDAAKNAAVMKYGAEILRFTGSEIFRNDLRCVREVENMLKLILGASVNCFT